MTLRAATVRFARMVEPLANGVVAALRHVLSEEAGSASYVTTREVVEAMQELGIAVNARKWAIGYFLGRVLPEVYPTLEDDAGRLWRFEKVVEAKNSRNRRYVFTRVRAWRE